MTLEEVNEALLDIDYNKSPDIDGFTAYFYKKTWGIIGHDVYPVVAEFLGMTKLLRVVNNTMVTLIPKITHLERVRHFRPIAYCSTLYK